MMKMLIWTLVFLMVGCQARAKPLTPGDGMVPRKDSGVPDGYAMYPTPMPDKSFGIVDRRFYRKGEEITWVSSKPHFSSFRGSQKMAEFGNSRCTLQYVY